MTDELLNQCDFAKLVGVSAARINKLVKAGRIPLVDKKIPKEKGLEFWNNREVGFEKAAIAGKKFGGDPKTTKNTSGIKQTVDDDEDVPASSEWGERFNRAKTLEKEQMAILRKFDNEVKQGLYVLKSEVERDAQGVAAELREKFLSLPSRLAAPLENKPSGTIQEVLEQEINEILEVLHYGRV